MSSPIVLVGLPRSGSTLISRVLNDSLNCFLVNDFYYLQYVESINGYTKRDQKTKKLLVDFIVNQLRNRTQPENLEDEVWFGLPFSKTDLEKISSFADTYKASGDSKNWAQILQDIMQFAAELVGRPTWGYNTPQDYLNFHRISEQFPNAKFIFLLRSPVATLLSYKYYWTTLPKFRHDRGRYHPLIQSLAWKTCVNTYFDLRGTYGQDKCMLVKFEDFLKKTDSVLADMSEFSGINFHKIDLASYGHNSSLSKDREGKQVRKITGLESRICHLITQKELHKLGYEVLSEQSMAFFDVFNLLATTVRNVTYYFRQIVFSPNVRKRVFKFMNQVASTSS